MKTVLRRERQTPDSTAPAHAVRETARLGRDILAEVSRAVVGKQPVLHDVLCAALAGGHVLLEDVPGVAKTLTARSFSTVLGCDFKRIQFTPDLMPADVTGSHVFDAREQEFRFRQGPLFAQVVLADELNRAPPKTQSALLEAMQESQVTVEGVTRALPAPFLVLATRNPIEQEGTYPLPEAQLDRFLIQTAVGYPSEDVEVDLIRRRMERGVDDVELRPVVDAATFLRMQQSLEGVRVDESLARYIVRVVHATRRSEHLALGASPRGTLGIFKLARARAALAGRPYVVPDDVQHTVPLVLAHRVRRGGRAHADGRDVRRVLGDVVRGVPVPA